MLFVFIIHTCFYFWLVIHKMSEYLNKHYICTFFYIPVGIIVNYVKYNCKLCMLCLAVRTILPITFTSHISTVVFCKSAPTHVDIWSCGRLFIYTISWANLLTLMFCMDAGHPDIGLWWYIKLFGCKELGSKTSVES